MGAGPNHGGRGGLRGLRRPVQGRKQRRAKVEGTGSASLEPDGLVGVRVDGEANSIYGRIPRNSKRVSKESREASRIGSPNDVCAAYTITPTARPGIRLVGRDDDDDRHDSTEK